MAEKHGSDQRQGPRLPQGLTPERALALAGVAGLLLTGLITLVLVVGAATGDDEQPIVAASTSTATPTSTPTATPKPRPTPVPLTPEQREERSAAVMTVEQKGFEVVRARDWDPRRTLRVLIGRQTSGGRSLAFFFVRDRGYIGNDTSAASAKLRVRRSRDTVVTLEYGIFAPGDTPDKPTANPERVRFQWDGGSLRPLDPVPPESLRTTPPA